MNFSPKIFLALLLGPSLVRAKDSFPCDLNNLTKPLPKLIFLGEIHETKRADDMEKEAIKSVKAKKSLYGKEGDFNDEPNYSKKAAARLNREYVAGVVGIDDPVAHSIATLLKVWSDPKENKDALSGLIEATHNHKLLRSLWNQTKKQLKSEKEKNTGDLIDLLISTDGNVSPKFLDDKATMKNIIEKWAKTIADFASKPENQQKYLPPPKLPQLVDDYFHGSVDTSVLFKGIWRNILMTRNIAKLYCEAAAKGMDLRISVGNKHVPGLKRLLNNLAKNVRIPMEDGSNKSGEKFLPEENLKLYWKHFTD